MTFSDLSPDDKLNDANLSSFGDLLSESMEPITQISAVYGFVDNIETFDATGGSVTATDNKFVCSTGTSVGGYGVIRTKRPVLYREGQGLTARFAAQFDSSAVANSEQGAGWFNLTDTIVFGYRGADFGIIFDTYGAPEIRQLQVTASGNGTLTLTLDGVAYSIPITTGTVEHNAYEIETWLNANQTIWSAQQVDDNVIFQAMDTSARTGTYSVSGTTLAGTFSQVEAGAAKTQDFIAQANWNNDKAGWLTPENFNVYMIKISYLGFGPIKFFAINPNTDRYELVHTIRPIEDAMTKPSISKRALKIGVYAASLGSTTDLTVNGASAAGFIDGESRIFSQSRSVSYTNTSVGSTYVAVLTLRGSEILNSKVNLGRLVPNRVSIATDATKPLEYILVKNATLGETDFTSYSTSSIAQYDTNAHTYTGTIENLGDVVSQSGSRLVKITDLDIELLLNETFTVFARKTSGTNPSVTVSITWKEDV